MEGIAKTLKDRQTEINAFAETQIETPSVFRAYDPEAMRFQPDKYNHLLPHSEIERNFHGGRYSVADMFLMKALNCFTYAPTECVWLLLKYWHEEEKYLASKEAVRTRDGQVIPRPTRAIPNFKHFSDVWVHLTELANNGVVGRYNFCPQVAKPGREGKPESVFKVGSYGVAMYRKVLNENAMPYNPIDAYANPEDVFAFCLNAYAIVPFLYSKYLKTVKFKESRKVNRRECKVRCIMTFNPDGRDGAENKDTDVIFESLTFKTNPNVVTAKSRFDSNTERIRELNDFYEENAKKTPTFLIFDCEDKRGRDYIAKIILSNHSKLLDRCLFTSGNVLFASNCLYEPQNLQNCFQHYELTEDKTKYVPNGAAGYYFTEIGPLDLSLDTNT